MESLWLVHIWNSQKGLASPVSKSQSVKRPEKRSGNREWVSSSHRKPATAWLNALDKERKVRCQWSLTHTLLAQ